MKKEIKKSLGLFFLGIIICVFSVFLSNYSAYAKNKSSSKNNNENSDAEYYYKNEKTGYEAYIFDESDPGLLTEKEKEKLLDDIKGVTTYGNVIFYSNDNSDYEGSAKKRYTKYFGEESGTIFAINMNKRKITLWSYGDVLDVISKGRSDVIVSNTYSYATKKKYYKCASEVFAETETLLKGGHVSMPMKHMSNALLALAVVAFINFIIILVSRSREEPAIWEIIKSIDYKHDGDVNVKFTHTTKKYDPPSSSSSDSGGGGGGGGGGGSSHSF